MFSHTERSVILLEVGILIVCSEHLGGLRISSKRHIADRQSNRGIAVNEVVMVAGIESYKTIVSRAMRMNEYKFQVCLCQRQLALYSPA